MTLNPAPLTPSVDDDPALNRLRDTFQGKHSSTHVPLWDQLWRESRTSWDRGGPSHALHELLVEHGELVLPSSPQGLGRRPRALVPGCGRGYDALLLSAHGFDVWGLDSSPTALEMARKTEHDSSGSDMYASMNGVEEGNITWVLGDFFDETLLSGQGGFDLIYDYTVSPAAVAF